MQVIFIFGSTDRSSSERAQAPPKRRHEAKLSPNNGYHLEGYHLGNLRHDTRVDDGRKAQNGQGDSSSVGCSRGSSLGLAKAEVRDTDFPSPSQLSVPIAKLETADSPPVGGVSPRRREDKTQVYHVYPTLAKPNSCCANVHRLGVFDFVCHRVHIAFGIFCVCLPSISYCLSPA